MAPLFRLSGIEKRFGDVSALAGVDFEVAAGEVHALLGENGAGKSTLIKCMTGVHPPDGGAMELGGRTYAPRTPADAVRAGVSTVYQEVNLLPNLSVGENLTLGREPVDRTGIRWAEARARASRALARVGLDADPRAPLASLSIARRQLVAIARALDVDARVLILDEPTSSLDADEAEGLLELVRRLRGEGLGIVFVSHFLDQVERVADCVTILREGQVVAERPAAGFARREIVSLMIGRDAASLERDPASPEKPQDEKTPQEPAAILAAERLGRKGAVADVSLTVLRGETLGLAGLLGSGRTETLRLLFGMDRAERGELRAEGRVVRRWTPRRAIRAGIGYLAEDRREEGIFPELTVRENVAILAQVRRGWARRLSTARQRALATEWIERLGVRPANPQARMDALSGGNQQKALLARWLAVEPRALLLDEPTRGIDVGAKFDILELVETLRRAGTAFVLVSSDLAEIVRAATKVLILRDRRSAGALGAGEISESAIVEEVAGR